MTPRLQLEHIDMHFPLPGGRKLGALNGVCLDVCPGEILGVVGESGCGKTTLARAIMGIHRPTGGTITFDGAPLDLGTTQARRAYARQVQMVFQNPYASLNPRLKIGQVVGEGLRIHQRLGGQERAQRVGQLLQLVGLDPSCIDRYPHEFSGGQRQRIGIARALAVEPSFLVCDEPISALDISIQAQVMNLLQRFHRELGLTMLFIAHDLNMVRYFCRRIAVMYMGHIVELGEAEPVCAAPLHPYTATLLGAVLTPDPRGRHKLEQPAGSFTEVASPMLPIVGCPFAPRCPKAGDLCRSQTPPLRQVAPGRQVACHYPNVERVWEDRG